MYELKLLSVLVYVLLLIGYANRRRRRLHISLMVTALAIDLGMVLFLELTRAVIESIPGREMTSLLVVHIALSTVVLFLYGIQVVTGVKNARGGHSRTHAKAWIWLLAARLGNLITSFWVV